MAHHRPPREPFRVDFVDSVFVLSSSGAIARFRDTRRPPSPSEAAARFRYRLGDTVAERQSGGIVWEAVASGEPQISAWTREEMAADLRSVGFIVREDSGMTDWNERFATAEAKVDRVAYMRVVVAHS